MRKGFISLVLAAVILVPGVGQAGTPVVVDREATREQLKSVLSQLGNLHPQLRADPNLTAQLNFVLRQLKEIERQIAQAPFAGQPSVVVQPQPVYQQPTYQQPVYQQPAPQGQRWSSQPAIIQACGRAFSGVNQSECMKAADHAAFDPAGVIGVCYQRCHGEPNMLSCVRAAVRAPVDSSALVERCYQRMHGDPNMLACIHDAVRINYSADSAIEACYQAMTGDPKVLACIHIAASANADPVGTINACHQSASNNDTALQCMRQALGR